MCDVLIGILSDVSFGFFTWNFIWNFDLKLFIFDVLFRSFALNLFDVLFGNFVLTFYLEVLRGSFTWKFYLEVYLEVLLGGFTGNLNTRIVNARNLNARIVNARILNARILNSWISNARIVKVRSFGETSAMAATEATSWGKVQQWE